MCLSIWLQGMCIESMHDYKGLENKSEVNSGCESPLGCRELNPGNFLEQQVTSLLQTPFYETLKTTHMIKFTDIIKLHSIYQTDYPGGSWLIRISWKAVRILCLEITKIGKWRNKKVSMRPYWLEDGKELCIKECEMRKRPNWVPTKRWSCQRYNSKE